MTRDIKLPLTGIALLTVLTGCTLVQGNEAAEPTPGVVTSATPPSTETPPTASPTPENTHTYLTPSPTAISSDADYTADPPLRSEFEADLKRQGLYMDEWVENVTTFLERESNLFIGLRESAYGDSLRDVLDYLTTYAMPAGFEVTHETTVGDNFVVRVWHPDAYHYYDEDTANEGRSDPLAPSSTPTPAWEEQFPVLQPIDAETTEVLYSLVTGAVRFENENDGRFPTDADIEELGLIPDGWEWSVDQSPSVPEHRIVRVWHPGGQIFNTEENAAYRDTFPKEEMRPDYNFDVDPLVPIMGVPIPTELYETPLPTPTSTPSPSTTQAPSVPLPTPTFNGA